MEILNKALLYDFKKEGGNLALLAGHYEKLLYAFIDLKAKADAMQQVFDAAGIEVRTKFSDKDREQAQGGLFE